ncbi:hypothetical protein [Aquimarina aquimarini]|uniref:hypothetical protein n=1 Tax=Aquimarina aquimarini TaxID=1191734 RepID=UPI00131F1E4D|nr:hypothetical protein [Aquimarina aquimarini]
MPVNIEIKRLKLLLQKDQIKVSEAVGLFTTILNNYNNEFDIGEEQIILNNVSKLNESIKMLLEDRRKVNERINNLNSIIVLQELGITFEEDELEKLLKR